MDRKNAARFTSKPLLMAAMIRKEFETLDAPELKPPMGECARCGFVTPLSGGLITHHKRLRRRKWLPCPGIASKPVETNLGKFVPLERPPAGFVDKRAASAPQEFTTGDGRYVVGVDPGNPTGPAVVIDSVTGEVVYRRKSGAKGVQ